MIGQYWDGRPLGFWMRAVVKVEEVARRKDMPRSTSQSRKRSGYRVSEDCDLRTHPRTKTRTRLSSCILVLTRVELAVGKVFGYVVESIFAAVLVRSQSLLDKETNWKHAALRRLQQFQSTPRCRDFNPLRSRSKKRLLVVEISNCMFCVIYG